MKFVLSLVLCLLLVGCSPTLQVFVKDGDCKPIKEAEVWYTLEGILSSVPFGPNFTSQAGFVELPSDTDTITVKKEGYKFAHFNVISSDPIEVFLYNELDEYESGLIDFKGCKENIYDF
ncbi:MAG: hypothetical protein ACYSUG_08275 [Planctomycetota bacterium]|jgi:hypothetical protein